MSRCHQFSSGNTPLKFLRCFVHYQHLPNVLIHDLFVHMLKVYYSDTWQPVADGTGGRWIFLTKDQWYGKLSKL